MNTPTILIGDKDSTFLEDLNKNQGHQIKLISAQDEKNIKAAIADHQTRYSAICLNTNLTDPAALPLIRFTKSHRPSTPLYLLSDNQSPPFTLEEAHGLHVQAILCKPMKPTDFINSIFPGSLFDLGAAMDLAKLETAKAGEEKEAEETGMHAIDAINFIGGKISFFDLFVRLSANRFVMILKAGDPLDPARLASYIAKNVKQFYIKKEAQHLYLQYCDKLTEAIVASDRLNLKQKSAQVSNLGRETSEYLKSVGLSEVTLQTAGRFVTHANSLIRRSGLDSSAAVKDYMADLVLADHGTSATILVSMIVQAMKFEDEKVLNSIAMAAMLHDIGLTKMPEHLRNEKEWAFTPAEKELFETHPKIGGDLLRKVPHLNPLLPQVVDQHHERRNRKGFPLKLGAGAISPVAEVVGIADAFLVVLAESRVAGSAIKDPMEEMRATHMNGFSSSITDAFFKAMQEEKKP